MTRPKSGFALSAFAALIVLTQPAYSDEPVPLRTPKGPIEVTEEHIKAAQQLFHIEFSPAERSQAVKGVQNIHNAIATLHHRPPPTDLKPALTFDVDLWPSSPHPAPAAPSLDSSLPSLSIAQIVESALAASASPIPIEDLPFATVIELAAQLRSGHVTSEQLTTLCLDRLEAIGPQLFCVVTLTRDRALEEARRADAEIARGHWRGPLHGIPYGVKDLLDVVGTPTTWGIALRTNHIAVSDSTVVRRLSDAGAVLVAKLSLGELAMGDVWHGGKTRNPWNTENGSSGSSAGSAASVAAGLLPFAIGSETLGSIVSPSTVCGVTGLRPTFGRIPRTGAMNLAESLDKLGPIARSAIDTALILDVLRGPDGSDNVVADHPFNLSDPMLPTQIRMGVLMGDFDKTGEFLASHTDALRSLRELGFDWKPVHLPNIPTEPLWLILAAEASASFDGLTRSGQDRLLVQQESHSWPNYFRRSRFIPAVEYLQANRLRQHLILEMKALFNDIDILVTPVWSGNSLLFSNMTGQPCIVLPNGPKANSDPASFCLIGRPYEESLLIAVAHAFQKATPWHKQHPQLSIIKTAPSDAD